MTARLIPILICLAAILPARADLQAGLAAFREGDYDLAYQEWLAASEAGSPEASFNIGLLHEQGKGFIQDAGEAAVWYLKAADAGFDRAQYRIAEMYESGTGVDKDYVQAHKWFKIAGIDRYKDARKRRSRVADRMTAKQISFSEMYIRDWKQQQAERERQAKQDKQVKKAEKKNQP